MAGEPLSADQEARVQKFLELSKAYKEAGNIDGAVKALEQAKELQANRSLTDQVLDFTLGENRSVDLPRAAGLTGRYIAEAAGGLADMATGPIKAGLNATGLTNYGTNTYSKAAGDALPENIFPKPQGDAEEMVAQASRFVASGGPFVKGGQALAKVPGLLGDIGTNLSSQPAMQATSAASAGLAGEATRQQGQSPLMQFAASLAGGLAPAGGRGLINAGRSLLPPGESVMQSLGDTNLEGLSSASIRRLQEAVAYAQRFGELDNAALARLVDFERVNATPTQASLTLDPVQKTQQKNLAKIGAQSTNPQLQQLAQIENQNNTTLVGQLDSLADDASLDPYAGGRAAIDPVVEQQAVRKAEVDELYTGARGTDGRAAPLQRKQFTERLNQLLVEGNLIRFLPKPVKKMVNDIAYGRVKLGDETFEVPFTVDTIDQLKTLVAQEQRTANGSSKQALTAVRKALDETQLQGGASDDSILAFDKAREAARALFQWEESAPGIKAIVDGATPDTFVNKYILSQAAGVDDVRKMVDVVRGDPAAFNALKFQVAAWIRDKAAPTLVAGADGAPAVGRLNSAGLNRALKQLGDRKLALFFSPQEIETIKATNRVAFYDAYQPPGSAVNNSNSATTLTGGLLNAVTERMPTARALATFGRGFDSLLNNPGRARDQMNPNLMMGGNRPPLLPALAAPLALPLLPQPDR
jgi:hypothetical protein